jgi:hypothetical protein
MEDSLPIYMTESEVRSTMAQIFDDRGAKATWSRENGVGRSTLSNNLSGDAPISAHIAKKLGFERVVRFIPIGGQR